MREDKRRLAHFLNGFAKSTSLLPILVFLSVSLFVNAGIAQESRNLTLVRALQSGGHAIYLRHAATDQTQDDSNRVALEDCKDQRNLSEKGREQARTIGAAFTALGITVSKIVAGPYCRTVETAKL